MKFSDIKVGHIYNVIFDPVRDCEFNGKHLAVVLKRNKDKQTFVVMPLTSEPNGEGINKIKLGKINSLPSSLRNNETYAVFNQIRTVNASRFISLKEGSQDVEAKINNEILSYLIKLGIKDMTFDVEQNERIKLFKKLYEEECTVKAINLAYNIKRLKKQIKSKEEEIESIKLEIKDILKDIPYKLEQKHIDNGIKNILDEITQNSN